MLLAMLMVLMTHFIVQWSVGTPTTVPETNKLFVELAHPSDRIPAAIFEVRCY